MTSLVMLAIMIFGALCLPAAAGQRPADHRLSRPSRSRPACPAPTRRPWPRPWPLPLERQFSTIAGLDSMTSTNGQGSIRSSPSSSPWRATSTRPPRTCRRPSPRRPASCRRTCRPRPRTRRSTRPTSRSSTWPSARRPCRCPTVNEFADTIIAPRISMINGVAQVLVYGSQKYAVRVQLDPRALASRSIGIDEVADGHGQRGNVNLPTGGLQGDQAGLYHPGQRPALRCRRPTSRWSWPTATARRCACADLGQVIDSVENDKVAAWYNTKGSRPAPSSWPSSASPAPTPSRWSTRIKQLLPTFREQLPGVGRAQHPLRPLRVDPRIGGRRQVHPAADHRPGDPGDLPLPAQRSRPPSSPAWPCRSPSSAPSPPCTCSASRSTTSP